MFGGVEFRSTHHQLNNQTTKPTTKMEKKEKTWGRKITYRTRWTDNDNVIIMLFAPGDIEPSGIVEVRIDKGRRKGQAYIWNLHVSKRSRRRGYGQALLDSALTEARVSDYTEAVLEWDLRDSPHWVLDWYCRQGFNESEFGNGCALMRKDLTAKGGDS